MKIEHLQLKWEDLPQAGQISLQPVEKKYLTILYIEWSILYGVVLVVAASLFFFIPQWRSAIIMVPAILLFLLLLPVSAWLVTRSFNFKGYAFRERDILSRSGWLFQQLQVVPLHKIQHCVVKTGPLEKKYGLASLRIYTAAQQTGTTLSGLKAEQAEQLKEWIVSKQIQHG